MSFVCSDNHSKIETETIVSLENLKQLGIKYSLLKNKFSVSIISEKDI